MGGVDGQAEAGGGFTHALVVGDDGLDVGAEERGGGQVDGVETAEPGGGSEGGDPVEQVTVEGDLVEAGQLAPGVGQRRRAPAENGPDDLVTAVGC